MNYRIRELSPKCFYVEKQVFVFFWIKCGIFDEGYYVFDTREEAEKMIEFWRKEK